jgi:hypothetical protein
MGRETTALVRWQGLEAEAKVLLESSELILRGGVKARFPRDSITNSEAGPSGLTLTIAGAVLHIAMSEVEAVRWAKAISTPPPSLAAKLGVAPDRPVFVQGAAEDPVLAEALEGATAASPDLAYQLLAVIENRAALDQTLNLARSNPALALWCVYPKGKAADPGDTAIRHAFRAAGWMDNKSTAVSTRLTATRYTRKA